MLRKLHNVLKKINKAHLMGLLMYLILVLGPFVFLLFNLARDLLIGKSDLISLINYSERRAILLGNSIKLALGVSFLGSIIGILIAVVIWNSKSNTKRNFFWLFILIVPIPSYIHALSWMYFINGVKYIAKSNFDFSGFYASLLVQLMSFLPLAIALALAGLERIDKNLLDAARVIRKDKDTLFKVVIPLAAPMIIACAGITFVLSIIDYSIPSLFQFNVYSLEIFSEYSASGNAGNAFLLSLPLLLITLFILVCSQSDIKNVALGADCGRKNDDDRSYIDVFKLPGWFKGLQGMALLIFSLQVAIPTLMLVLQAEAWKALFSSLSAINNELMVTFKIAAVTALLCLFPAYSVACLLKKNEKYSILLWAVMLVSVATPASLSGIAIVSMVNQPMLHHLSGSIIMPVLGAASRFIPFSVIILLAQLRRIDPLLIEAASILHNNPLKIWWKVKLPMMLPGILASICLVFVLTSSELGATLLLIPPGVETITIKIYNYLHYGATEVVAGLCLLMMITILLCGAGIIAMIKMRRKWLE